LLEVDYSLLTYLLYRSDTNSRYTVFSVSKRGGGARIISSPNKSLKILQAKLNEVLNIVYQPKSATHGFTLGRSIVTNAKPHTARRYVLNIDIQDFFTTINSGRVRGMFKAPPYRWPEKVATVLAQICCQANSLPQGAPTSPTVSNMICAKLDTELLRLAQKHSCWYSRYADDIAFSTNKRQFPDELAYSEHGLTIPGRELRETIESNGFSINPSKGFICATEITAHINCRQ
jgi:RNA-directed DNA polymerase